MGCCFSHVQWWCPCFWWSDRRRKKQRRNAITAGATPRAACTGDHAANNAQIGATGEHADRNSEVYWAAAMAAGLALVHAMATAAAATIVAMPMLSKATAAHATAPGHAAQAVPPDSPPEGHPLRSDIAPELSPKTPSQAQSRGGGSTGVDGARDGGARTDLLPPSQALSDTVAPATTLSAGTPPSEASRGAGTETESGGAAVMLNAGLVGKLEEEEVTKRLNVEREEHAARADTELREEDNRIGRFVVGMHVVARCLVRQGARTVQAGEVGSVQSPQDGVKGVPVKFGNCQKLVIVPESSLISKREADAKAAKRAAAEMKASVSCASTGGADEPGAVERRLKEKDAGGARHMRNPAVQDKHEETGAALCSTKIQCKEEDDAPVFQAWRKAARKGTRGTSSPESTITEAQLVQTASNWLQKPSFRRKWREALLANGLSGEEQPEDFDVEELRVLLCELFPECDLDRVTVSSSDSGIRASPTSSAGHHRAVPSGATADALGGRHSAAGQRRVAPPASVAQRPVAAGQGTHVASRSQHRGGDLAGRGRGAPLRSPATTQTVQQQDAGRPQRGARGGGRAQSGGPVVQSAAQGVALTFAEAARGARTAAGVCATAAPSPAAPGAVHEPQRDDDGLTAPLLPVGGTPGADGGADTGHEADPDADHVARAMNAGADYLRQLTNGALPYPPAAPAGGLAAPAGAPQTAAAAAAQHSGEAPQ
eukprot:TRINITY_DN7227_c0_g1_i4.p1 TRINITY_DN7227_c0_g1~~TRINITY_DN7227_c0_g1_i4.p1  ORF type:complete len:740 (+),score=57.15 TRINITY_DN7227_c0_g1_i4:78-2222(+)